RARGDGGEGHGDSLRQALRGDRRSPGTGVVLLAGFQRDPARRRLGARDRPRGQHPRDGGVGSDLHRPAPRLADGLHAARMMATPAPSDTARSLLRRMLRIRMIEQRIKALYAEQEMRRPTHFSIAQDAAADGLCARLTPEELTT